MPIQYCSVCPKGWKLPSSDSTAKGSFYYMLSQYGVQSNLSGTSSVNNNTYNIALSPLFFVRGGGIYPNSTSKFIVAGQNGYYWSSRASSGTRNAGELYFGTSGVNPSDGTTRYYGYSLRCLISTP